MIKQEPQQACQRKNAKQHAQQIGQKRFYTLFELAEQMGNA